MAETPCARSACTDSRTSSSLSGTSTRPFASSRSRAHTRRRCGARNVGVSGYIVRSYMRERFIRPSSSTSSKPAVVRTAVTAPFCSRMEVVAMVVPWIKRSTSAGRAPASPSTWLTAAPMPSRRSFGVLGTFVSASRPARSRATMSVKVPPMSTPICTVDLPERASAYHTPSRVHATLFEVELPLEAAQHVVADLARGPKPQQRLAFGVDDGASDLPVLDELAVFAVAVGGFALTLDVLGAMAGRLPGPVA